MKNFFSNKKFNSFFLVLVMVFSLFFFSACTNGEDNDSAYIKLIYRPYSTSKVGNSDVTYAELVEENVLSLSEDVLTQLVGAYGPNSITIMDGLLPTTIKPSLNGVDYKSLFGYGTLGSFFSSEDDFALELGTMTNLYFSTENNLVTLSQGDLTSSDIVDIALLIAQLAIPGAAADNIQIVSGSIADLNALLRISTGDLYYYVFYGGKIGGNDYISAENDFQNAKNYFARILNSNYNVIEKDFTGVNIVDESSVDLNFAHWKYNLLNGNLDNAISSGNEYLNKFLEKYTVPFAAHVAKAMLVGGEALPNDIPSQNNSLASLYEQTKTGDKAKCEQFIKKASNYIDHIGMTKSNIDDLMAVIKSEVIGDGALQTEKIYDNSENSVLYRNNYATIIPACLNKVLEDNPQKPILEYTTVNGNFVEDVEIDGYLQSILVLTESTKEVSDVVAELILQENVVPEYHITLRHCYNDMVEDYPFQIEEDDFKEGSISFSVDDEYSHVENLKVENSKDILEGDFGSILDGNLHEYFILSQYSNNTSGYAWCLNDYTNSYVQIVFATNSIFDMFKVDINCFGT